MLEVKNLTVAFPEGDRYYPAVEDVSFAVEDHSTLGIVGESGSGKSVTVQTMLGIQHPKAKILSGEVIFHGEDLIKKDENELAKIRGRQIAMIFQEPMTALNPVMKVGRQIREAYVEHNRNATDALERTYGIMRDVGLRDVEELYNAYPHELSGGMRQRISIAMALIAEPEILIADEPTTALDATIRAQILRLFNKMKEVYQGSIVFISHDLGVVSAICERTIVMYAGRIVEEGKSSVIATSPKHPYTVGLMRAIPSYKQRGTKLHNIPGYLPPIDERDFKGCPFAPRCEKAMEICHTTPPAMTEEDGHRVYCHLYGGSR